MPHIHTGNGEYDFTVSGYVVHDNKTLLIKHKTLPVWTPPAGHIEVHQTPIDALYAEIEEEAGITRDHLTLIETCPYPSSTKRGSGTVELPLPFDFETHPINTTHRHINLAYVLMSDTDKVTPGPGESMTYRWFTSSELREFTETNESLQNTALRALEIAAVRSASV